MDIVATGFRIKQAIGLTGYNVKEFCERTHRSRVTTALWIAGRGGAIKEANVEELCADLLNCNVVCEANWIYTGEGPSPTLLGHKQAKLNDISHDVRLKYFEKIQTAFAKKYDQNNLIEYNGKQYYSVAIRMPLSDVKVDSKSFYQIQLRSQQSILGNIIAECQETNTIVITDHNDSVKCIPKKQIEMTGNVIFLYFK